MPKSRGPRNTWPQQKRHALQKLGRKRLSLLKAKRKAQQAMIAQRLGYEPARLSSQVKKPGNYTRTGTKIVIGKGGVIVEEQFIAKRHHKRGCGKGGGSAERISHRTGSAVARAGKSRRTKYATMGAKPRREKKKKKKNY